MLLQSVSLVWQTWWHLIKSIWEKKASKRHSGLCLAGGQSGPVNEWKETTWNGNHLPEACGGHLYNVTWSKQSGMDGPLLWKCCWWQCCPLGIQRGFAEVDTKAKCSFAENKKWTKLQVELNRVGEVVEEVAVSQNTMVFISPLVWLSFKTQTWGCDWMVRLVAWL